MAAEARHPLAELLECPPETANLLSGSAQCIDFKAGQIVFGQNEIGQGLYLVISGVLQRQAERMRMRLTLGAVRAGDLVELAAALGECSHTYSLRAQTDGCALLLPIQALREAFQAYPPLRMNLLEELAREVSRAYRTCCLERPARTRGLESGAAAG
jgi:CRP-like cAMP-binding protein